MKFVHKDLSQIMTIIKAIAQHKGRALLVGGAVRDMVLGLPVKDIDIEVYGLIEAELEKVLRQFGVVNCVGKSFGVLRLSGLDVDWSLPRTDQEGRKPHVMIDPFMPIEKALRRRDLTMNAMAYDITTQDLIDPFGGIDDIQNKILRTPDPAFFVQDPLRFFRVMQFIGRFEMVPDKQLDALCSKMDIAYISRERIEQEFHKLLLFSKKPSLGIRWLKDIGRLHDILPELADTIGVVQEHRWHPEGDVFEHSMQAVDAAAIIAKKYTNDFNRLVLLYAALSHDLGKVSTTIVVNRVIKSYGHEVDGQKLARAMLKRITHNGDLIAAVERMVRYHMDPFLFIANNASLGAYRRLARKIAPHITMLQLLDLSIADKRGRNGHGHEPLTIDLESAAIFLEKITAAQVQTAPIKPLLHGEDIMQWVTPGPEMGMVLKKAYDIQLSQGVVDKSELLERMKPILNDFIKHKN